jgi:hypothetical protein
VIPPLGHNEAAKYSLEAEKYSLEAERQESIHRFSPDLGSFYQFVIYIIWALFCCCLNYEEPGAAVDAIGSGVTMLQLKIAPARGNF